MVNIKFIFLLFCVCSITLIQAQYDSIDEQVQKILQEQDMDFDLFALFDTNEDQQISTKEFMDYLGQIEEVSQTLGQEDWQQSAVLAFKVYDKNEDQLLDQNQFQHFVEQMYALSPEDEQYDEQFFDQQIEKIQNQMASQM